MVVIKLLFVIILFVFSVALAYRLRLAFEGMKVNSWIRTPWKNKDVGGVTTSRHMLALAFDISRKGVSRKQIDAIGFDKVIPYTGHWHVRII